MKWDNTFSRISLAFVTFEIASLFAGVIVPAPLLSSAQSILWIAISNLLITIALGYAAMKTSWRGWRLGIALAGIVITINLANLSEGFVFLANTRSSRLHLLLQLFITYVLTVPVWTLIFSKGRTVTTGSHPFPAFSGWPKLWRFVVSDFMYFVFYVAAGLVIFPFVRHFYDTLVLPSFGTIMGLQLLFRGPLFVICCLLLMYMMGSQRLPGAIAVGIIFTAISGIAPLLIPSTDFPDSIRLVHLCEIGSTNFLLGAFVGWIWGSSQTSNVHHEAQEISSCA
jgi:hypothetical protein